MIIEKVQANRAAARKDVARVIEFNILTLLVGEMETAVKREGKMLSDASDEMVIAQVRKLIKSNNEMISMYSEVGGAKFVKENEILSAYLPKQMTDEELTSELQDILFSSVGEAIKSLNEKFPGRFDKAKAAKIAGSLL